MRHEGGVWLRWVRRRREGGAVLCRHTGRSKVEQNDLTRVAAVLVVLAVAKLADRPDDRLRHAGRDRDVVGVVGHELRGARQQCEGRSDACTAAL